MKAFDHKGHKGHEEGKTFNWEGYEEGSAGLDCPFEMEKRDEHE